MSGSFAGFRESTASPDKRYAGSDRLILLSSGDVVLRRTGCRQGLIGQPRRSTFSLQEHASKEALNMGVNGAQKPRISGD
jgi:3-oxoacyl-[acyl-carrier-protein] synthase III